MREDTLRLQLEPLAVLLRHTLQQLQAQDSIDVFALPVPLDEVHFSVVFIAAKPALLKPSAASSDTSSSSSTSSNGVSCGSCS